MPLDDSRLLAALASQEPIDAVCRAAGCTQAEFAAARDAFLAAGAPRGDRRLTGAVGGKVEILRDRAGVPHVWAGSTADAWFGVGVAMTEDRLWQMDRLRRRALGRQAEILGPAFVASDAAHLTVGLDKIAAREPARLDGKTHETIRAFVAGINRRIEEFGAALPVEFRLLGYAPGPFTVSDVVAIARGMWWLIMCLLHRTM